MTDPTEPLRQLARDPATTPEQARLVAEFATRLEAQHNQQNNNWQSALGGTDLHLTAEIDRLRQELTTRLDAQEQQQMTASSERAELRQKLVYLATLTEQIRELTRRLAADLEARPSPEAVTHAIERVADHEARISGLEGANDREAST